MPDRLNDNYGLPATLDNGTPISWTSDKNTAIRIDNSTTAVVICNLAEQTVKLTADAGSGNTKEFTVTVERLTKIEKGNSVYEFTADKLTYKDFNSGILSIGNLYNLTVDPSLTEFTVTLKSIYFRERDSSSGEWLTVEQFHSKMLEFANSFIRERMYGFKNLMNKSNITMEDLKQVFDGVIEDEHYFNSNFGEFITYADFMGTSLSPQQKTEKIKKGLDKNRKMEALAFGLLESASWDEILSKAIAVNKVAYQQVANEDKTSHTYIYEITKEDTALGYAYKFKANVKHNPTKPWYENSDRWKNSHTNLPNSASPNIGLRGDKMAGIIEGYLEINAGAGHKNYRGTFTEDRPDNFTFTGQTDGEDPHGNPIPVENITAIITDNKDGTLTLTITSGGSGTYTLNFEGESLSLH